MQVYYALYLNSRSNSYNGRRITTAGGWDDAVTIARTYEIPNQLTLVELKLDQNGG